MPVEIGSTVSASTITSNGPVTDNGSGNTVSMVRDMPSPVGHWTFDDGTGSVAADSSGNGNHSTVTPALCSAVFNKVPPAPRDDVFVDSVQLAANGIGEVLSLVVPVSGLGHSYQVLSTSSLADPNWQAASGVLAGNGGELAMEVPVDGEQTNRFCKLAAWR
jgi:hypothetical protein